MVEDKVSSEEGPGAEPATGGELSELRKNEEF